MESGHVPPLPVPKPVSPDRPSRGFSNKPLSRSGNAQNSGAEGEVVAGLQVQVVLVVGVVVGDDESSEVVLKPETMPSCQSEKKTKHLGRC